MAEPARRLTTVAKNAATTDPATFMSLPDIERYAENASPEVLDCRTYGRHRFPPLSRLPQRFVWNGMWHTRRSLCEHCQAATRVEYWEIVERAGVVLRADRVRTGIDYDETYKPPPELPGRIKPKALLNALMVGTKIQVAVGKET